MLALSLGSWYAYQSSKVKWNTPAIVTTISVLPENLEVVTTAPGIVELGGQQTFKAPNDVTVEAVLVDERQRVNAGDALIILRDRGLQRELSTQLVTNQIDENVLSRNREIVSANVQKLQEQEIRLEESEALFEQGFISEDDLQGDKDEVDIARSNLRDAQVELANAELKVQNNLLITQSLKSQLADNKITSPIDAEVLKVEVKPGDGVQQEGRLLTIGDPTKEIIRLQLPTLNASKVEVNMPVRVSVIGPNPELYSGRISQISPQALSSNNEDERSQQAQVEAQAILDNPSNTLIPGSSVSVEIILAQRKDVVVVPLSALHSEGDSQFVWVRDQVGKAQKREVEVGLKNLNSTEVISGLEIGDELIVSIPSDQNLTNGVPVESDNI